VSMAGYCLDPHQKTATASIDGNICRCTGYKSIQRAAARVEQLMAGKKSGDSIEFATVNKILPSYFKKIREQLVKLRSKTNGITNEFAVQRVGGGTDLYVQRHEEVKDASIQFLFDHPELNGIIKEGNTCWIGSAATVTDLKESAVMRESFFQLDDYIKLVSSTPIRNMATIAGNFVNASPIGDFTIFFLALDAQLVLSDGSRKRAWPLRKFYKGYKLLEKTPEEIIEKISFELPDGNCLFNFEKVSKRTHLDIASVNSAMLLRMNGNKIISAGVSAGGVGPVPMYLEKASDFLSGKTISETLVHEMIQIAVTEISPISDARGSAEYKTQLLSQLIKAHFLKLFPNLSTVKILATAL
jgi:xanthine dehydrogenase small subunit